LAWRRLVDRNEALSNLPDASVAPRISASSKVAPWASTLLKFVLVRSAE
jgi:hypothetical protein